MLGALPFCAIGMFVGSLVSGQAVAGHREPHLPAHGVPVGPVGAAAVHAEGPATSRRSGPRYHLAQMALDTVGAPSAGTIASHIAVLAGITLLFFLLAMRRMHGSGFAVRRTAPKRALALRRRRRAPW